MVDRPSELMTFLFTDLERSTPLWDEHPDEMRRRSRGTTRPCARPWNRFAAPSSRRPGMARMLYSR
jgi:hypothetical protein